jgi:hypothetical protein
MKQTVNWFVSITSVEKKDFMIVAYRCQNWHASIESFIENVWLISLEGQVHTLGNFLS